MNKIKKKAVIWIVLVLAMVAYSNANSQLSLTLAEDDQFRIECEQPEYRWIGGTHTIKCNVTNKLNLKTIHTGIFFEENKVKVKEIKVNKQDHQIDKKFELRSKGWRRPTANINNPKRMNTVEFIVDFDGIGYDKFWVTTDSGSYNLELDPAVSGCNDTDPDWLVCAGGTFTGDNLNSTKNIRIFNATIDATASGFFWMNSSKSINITDSSILSYFAAGQAAGQTVYASIYATDNLFIHNTTVISNGNDPTGNDAEGGNGIVILHSENGNITVEGSYFEYHGGNGNCVACGAGNFGGYSRITIESPQVIDLFDLNLTGYGGSAAAGTGTQGGGNAYTTIKANEIIINSSSDIHWLNYGGNGGYVSGAYTCGGDAEVLINASEVTFSGQNISQQFINFSAGKCDSTYGDSLSKINVNDLLIIDNNVTFDIQSSTPYVSNNSHFSFNNNESLRLLLSATSIPFDGFTVLCDQAQVDLDVAWLERYSLTQKINFTYCDYLNISRYDIENYANQPKQPTFTSPTPADGLDIVDPNTVINISTTDDWENLTYYLYLANHSSFTDADLVLTNATTLNDMFHLYTNSLVTEGTYYYQAKTYNVSNQIFSKPSELRSFDYYPLPRIDNCSTYTIPILNFFVLNESTDASLNASMEFLLTYQYTSGSSNTSNYSVTKTWHNISFCMEQNNSITADALVSYTIDSENFEYNMVDQTLTHIPTNINLYYSTGTTSVTINVVDENDEDVPSAFVYVDIYDIPSDSFSTVEVLETDGVGECLANLILNDEYYRFRVYYDGSFVYSDTKRKITDTSITLQISTAATPLNVPLLIHDLNVTLTANTHNKTFSLTYGTITNILSQMNFEVYQINITNNTRIHQTIILGDDSNLSYTIPSPYNSSGVYVANVYGYYINTSDRYLIASETIDIRTAHDIFGSETVFMSFIFVGTMALIGVFASAEAGIVLTIFGMVAFYALGFYIVALSGLVSMIVGLVLVLVRKKEK